MKKNLLMVIAIVLTSIFVQAEPSKEEKKAAAKVKRDNNIYCSCERFIQQQQKIIDKENAGAKYSGYVNKNVLHRAGGIISNAKEVQEEVSKRSPASATCEKLPDIFTCADEMMNLAYKKANQ